MGTGGARLVLRQGGTGSTKRLARETQAADMLTVARSGASGALSRGSRMMRVARLVTWPEER